jgi:hypothetical protein
MIGGQSTILIAVLFFATALLYSSVGLAGATSYLAVMALFGFPPAEMKSTALALNILVAAIASIKFYWAGYFSWRTFWPFALTSIPFAYLGGRIALPENIYKPIISLVLFYTAYRLLQLKPRRENSSGIHPAPLWASLGAGAGMGVLSGLTGIGGGILLGPLLLLMDWADARQAAAATAVFNLVNSIAGLTGSLMVISNLPNSIPIYAVAAGLGGWIGAEYGSHKLASRRLQQILAIILIIAGIRMLF